MKRRNVFLVLGGVVLSCALITILFMVTGCGGLPQFDITTGGPEPEGEGTLVLGLEEPAGPKMVLPGGDIDFDHYIVKIIHQVTLDEMSQQITPPPYEVTFANIPSGDYDILVTGFNALDELLGTGVGFVAVLANDTSQETVQVHYETGNGDLQIDYTLVPPDLIYSPGIEGELWDQTSWSPVTIVEDSPGAWSYDESLPSGFYAHRFELKSFGDQTISIAGGMEAVFIMTGRLTAGAYEFNETNITPGELGSTIVIIWEPQDMPFNTYFTDGLSQVDTNEQFILEAAADIAVDTWYWFKNGVELVGENNSSLVQTASDEERYDNYSVLAKAGGALSSAQKIIESMIPPPQLSYFEWTSPTEPQSRSGEAGSYLPLVVDMFDFEGLPEEDGTIVYWRIASDNIYWQDPEYIILQEGSSTLVVDGSAGNRLNVIQNVVGLCYGFVEVACDPEFTESVTVSPEILFHN